MTNSEAGDIEFKFGLYLLKCVLRERKVTRLILTIGTQKVYILLNFKERYSHN